MHRIKYKTQFSLNKKPENVLKAEEVNQIYQIYGQNLNILKDNLYKSNFWEKIISKFSYTLKQDFL